MLAELGLADLAPMPSTALAVVTDRGGASIAVPKGSSYRSSSETDLRDLYSSNNNCDTLDLSKELKQAAEHCQLLAEKIRRKGDHVKTSADETNPDRNCCHDVRTKYRRAMAENIKYRQVIKDVTEINKRWQKYNRQQQEYIQRLLGTIQTVQQEKAELEVSALLKRPLDQESEHRRMPLAIRHSDSSLMDQPSMMSQMRHCYENAVKDTCQLQKDLEEATRKERELSEEMQGLKAMHAEEVDLLQMQMTQHMEDWEAERKEKHAEKQEKERLKQSMDVLKNKLSNCEDRLQSLELACRCGAVDEMDGWRMLRRHRSSSPTVPYPFHRNISVDGKHSQSQPELLERGSSVVPSAPEASKTSIDDGNNRNDVVVCPGCQKNFPSEEHVNFLDHFESCQNK